MTLLYTAISLTGKNGAGIIQSQTLLMHFMVVGNIYETQVNAKNVGKHLIGADFISLTEYYYRTHPWLKIKLKLMNKQS